MPTVEILAWDYTSQGAPDSRWNKGDGTVFERTLDDQEVVSRLYEQFKQLDRGLVSHGASVWVNICKYRYLFRFFVNGSAQEYAGLDHSPLWQYSDQTHRMSVEAPDMLKSLHESIGLPWEPVAGFQ